MAYVLLHFYLLPAKDSIKSALFNILPFLMICTFAFFVYYVNDFYQYSTISQDIDKSLQVYLNSFFIVVKNLIYPVSISFYTPPFNGWNEIETSSIILSAFGILIFLAVLLIGYFSKNRQLLLPSAILISLLLLSRLFIESEDLINSSSPNYFVTVGYALFIGTIFNWVNRNKSIINIYISVILVFIVITAYGITTFKKMGAWKNELTLWNSVLEFYPKNQFAESQKQKSVKYHQNLLLSRYGAETPNIRFNESSIDLGTIQVDENRSIDFEFVNLGDSPVIINKVITSCGCTSTQWTNVPVLPNNNGSISASINPTGINGHFSKSISVLFNSCKEPFKLTIKGNVKKSN
jgi:hypothetical protein